MIACLKAPHRSDLEVINNRAVLPRITQWILDVCKSAELSDKTSFAVQLCLDEAIANVMEHSFDGLRATKISIGLLRESADVILTIEDDGGPFDPTTAEAPKLRETLDDTPVGGLGIHLIRSFARDLRYLRSEGRNRLQLTFANV